MKKIYLDNSATTPLDKKVLSAMSKYWAVDFGNPGSIHSMGVRAKIALQNARKNVAAFVNGHDREIIFTSGGTEANNLVIFGLINRVRKENRKYSDIHLITTEIEHSSIYECFAELEKRGCKVDYLKVNEYGLINPKDLREMITPHTLLVSVGYANSEIGVIQPIKEIIKEIRHKRNEFKRDRISMPYFHIDASQAGLYLNMNVEELGVDFMTIDAQKMYGPKGVGALYLRDGVKIEPLLLGGGQERGMRSGTENIPLIVGFAEASKIASKIKNKEIKRIESLRNYFIKEIKKISSEIIINGSLNDRLPNNINISILKMNSKFGDMDGEMMTLRLDEEGIICSSASACASGSGESVVVRKIAEKNVDKKEADLRAKTTLRFSLGRQTKKEDMVILLKKIKKLLA